MIPEESVPEQIRSLKRVLSLNFEEVYCQHAGRLEQGREQLTKKLDYLERLTDNVITKTAAGYNIDDINSQLFPEPSPLVKISKRDYDSRHMIASILREVFEQLR